MSQSTLLEKAQSKANHWLKSNIDEHTRSEIQRMLSAADPKELIDNFYKDLEFGTGGLRGIMGTGANCMNKYTVGAATQGLANYLLKVKPNKSLAVAIAYDSRNNSNFFAGICADVFSANGITVHLFPALRPTPLLSFAMRHLKCDSGVVITASHNPKEYNGFKAYWEGGAQLVPPHDKNVIEEVTAIKDFRDIRFTPDPARIQLIGPEVEAAYYQEVMNIIPGKESIRRQRQIPLAYSSLHGAGITMVPACLRQLGFENLHIVAEQKEPDGDFPTITSPNPEEQSAMVLVLKKAVEVNAALVMATDPDTDRVGFGIRDHADTFFLLSGNQAFSLMMWFILKNLKEKKDTYIVKTIVTTELVDRMASDMGVTCYNTLTGFKYIAELMEEMEGKKKFIAAGEESYGYMVGDFVRDKDAVSACAFFAAMAAAALDEGKTLYDWLLEMYVEFGFYKESLVNLVRKGAAGEQQIREMMEKLRKDPPRMLAGEKVVRKLDYKSRQEEELVTGKTIPIALPASDVLQFITAGGSKISIRPSGTEPKIKFYFSIHAPLPSKSEFAVVSNQLDEKLAKLRADLGI